MFSLSRFLPAVALIVLSGSAIAGMGIDPKTIEYKDWGPKKPTVTVVFAHTGQKQALLGSHTTGDFLWEGNPEMTQLGMALYGRNNWTRGDQSKETGFLRYAVIVRERYLGQPEGLLAVLRPDLRGAGPQAPLYFLSHKDVRDIPFGAKKVAYLSIAMGAIRQGTELIVVSFDDITDSDMRRIAFEEGVLRHLKYRED